MNMDGNDGAHLLEFHKLADDSESGPVRVYARSLLEHGHYGLHGVEDENLVPKSMVVYEITYVIWGSVLIASLISRHVGR